MTTRTPAIPTDLADMLAGLVDSSLEGAACAGRWHLFDPPEGDEDTSTRTARQARARALCQRCPVLDRCAAYATTSRRPDRAGFTLGGRTYNTNGKPYTRTGGTP